MSGPSRPPASRAEKLLDELQAVPPLMKMQLRLHPDGPLSTWKKEYAEFNAGELFRAKAEQDRQIAEIKKSLSPEELEAYEQQLAAGKSR
mmetsp:Transcript_106997/g.276759  ORF Transcript_106997/g.276759 Transcript_106997/m.276759 type:complete len:90 (-) Transcript_106997:34-303(-)